MEFTSHSKLSSRVSRIAFGGDPLGGHNWGHVDQAEATRAVRSAVDKGITLFDTADCYGGGLSEQRMGAALKEVRNDVLIASKFGVRLSQSGGSRYDNSPKWILEAVEGSLKRLGTDYIDLYQLHWWDRVTPFENIWECLEQLRRQGKIRSYGATNTTLEIMGLAGPGDLPETFVSLSMEFSLIEQKNRAAIDGMCRSADGGETPLFLSWGSLGAGLLSGKYRAKSDLLATDRRITRTDSHFAVGRIERNLQIVDICREVAAECGPRVTTAQVALQWIVRRLGYGICLVGIKNTRQLDEAAGAFDFTLAPDQVSRLNAAARPPE